MSVAIRGSTVTFTFTFTDEDEAEATPDSATVKLAYFDGLRYKTETLDLEDNGDNEWVVTWNSSAADRGWVHYHAEASDPQLSVRDGRFRLRGNRANRPDPSVPENMYPTEWWLN